MGSQNVLVSSSSLLLVSFQMQEVSSRNRPPTSHSYFVTVTRLFPAWLASRSPVSFTTESELKAEVGMQEPCGLSLMLMPLPQPHHPIFQWEIL